MPKTKTQNFIFTFMTALLMAYLMIVYSVVINSGQFMNQTFVIALHELPLEFIIVFLCAFFIASPLAKKLAFRIINPKNDRPIFVILAIQSFTVCIMVTLMSLYACYAQQLINVNFICNWILLICKNFLFAYPLQIFVVGPIVRNFFRLIIK